MAPVATNNINKKSLKPNNNKDDSLSLKKESGHGGIITNPKTWSSILMPWPQIKYFAKSACIKVLKSVQKGFIKIIDANGISYEFGNPESDEKVTLTVLDSYFWVRLAAFSSMGFGEAYMNGEIQVDDLTLFLVILVKNREYFNEMNLLPAGLNWVINNLVNSRIPNTIINALTNIQAHYDLGNEMFASFLDPTMSYSCPIWKSENESLEQAQYNKIDAMLDKACLTSEDHFLEIGTGWGALAIRAVTRFGCKVTSLTLSKEQKILAEERIAKAGLSDKITVLLCDYRKLNPKQYQFDKIVTVEMLEAVGSEFLPVFFEQCNKLLKAQGVLVLQVITMPDNRYENYLRKTDFIQKYIFPGGHCPSITALTNAIYKGSQGDLIIDHIENIGPHYAKALRLWNDAFLANYDDVVNKTQLHHIYDQVFKRKWEYYFCYCRAGFATRTLGDVQMRLTKVNNQVLLNDIPM